MARNKAFHFNTSTRGVCSSSAPRRVGQRFTKGLGVQFITHWYWYLAVGLSCILIILLFPACQPIQS